MYIISKGDDSDDHHVSSNPGNKLNEGTFPRSGDSQSMNVPCFIRPLILYLEGVKPVYNHMHLRHFWHTNKILPSIYTIKERL